MYTKYKLAFFAFIFILISLFLVQVFFYFLQFYDVKNMSKGFQSILRRDFESRGPDYISKSIKDLEVLHLVECSTLKNQSWEGQSYYLNYATSPSQCQTSFWQLNGVSYQNSITALNGDQWVYSFKTINSNGLYSALWLARLLVIISLYALIAFISEKVNKKIQIMEKENFYNYQIAQMAKQVSHDIRSPLAAISMAMKDIDMIPEAQRTILRQATLRIQDIANHLLTSSRQNKDKNENIHPSYHKSETEKVLLYSCIDEILSEKRIQFKSKVGMRIEGHLETGFHLFSLINASVLKRIVSNLINNALESYPDETGSISLTLHKENEMAIINITDQGKGIAEDKLSQIGHDGVSFGKDQSKESGSGLGLYHAISSIKQWGGDTKITSQLGAGTNIKIQLPLCDFPSWYQNQIKIQSNTPQVICILDDDQEIHQTWIERFKQFSGLPLALVHFSSPEQARKWFISQNQDNKDQIIFLCDYEIIGSNESGLDFIESLNLQNQSTLVTSHYNEEEIQIRCTKQNVKILPKMMAPFVPISFILEQTPDYLEILYIEDDKYLRKAWELEAKKNEIHFMAIESPEKFTAIQAQVSKEKTKIYIDQNYGDLSSLTGIEFAIALHQEGYQFLYLATGHRREDLNCPNWLVVTGKEPPWEAKC